VRRTPAGETEPDRLEVFRRDARRKAILSVRCDGTGAVGHGVLRIGEDGATWSLLSLLSSRGGESRRLEETFRWAGDDRFELRTRERKGEVWVDVPGTHRAERAAD
jgi:hypothetical protein